MKKTRGDKVRCPICSGKLRVVDTTYRRKWKFKDVYSGYEIGQVERRLECGECRKKYRSIERIFNFRKKLV